MALSVRDVLKLVDQGEIPSYLLANWHQQTGKHPLVDAVFAEKMTMVAGTVFWLLLLILLTTVAELLNPALVVGLCFFGIFSAIMYLIGKCELHDYKRHEFGGDYAWLLELLYPESSVGVSLASYPEELLRGMVHRRLREKRRELQKLEREYAKGGNTEDVECARDEFGDAFALACRFGFADEDVGVVSVL